jgi:hypothetical protein
MPDAIAAGDGAPPPAAPAAGIIDPPAQQAEENTSVLEYARRKLRQKRESTGPKVVKGQSASPAQVPPPTRETQPAEPGTNPVPESDLSQAAESANAEEAPAAAPEVPETSSEEPRPSETEGGDEQDLPEDAPDWYKKRIARFTRQKGDLERKLAELETDRNAIRSEFERQKAAGPAEPPLPVVVNQADPASQFVNEQQLDQAASQARQLRRWCELNPEGGTLQVPNKQGGYDQREFSAEQVREMRFAAEDDLEQHLPRRREHLRQEQAITSQAVRKHPWLTDKNNPRMALFRKVIESDPSIRLRPDWAEVTAIFVRGLEALDSESRAASAPSVPKPKTGTPPPKLPGPSATAPPRKGPIAAGQAELTAAEKAWSEAPSQRTFARLQAVKRQMKAVNSQ